MGRRQRRPAGADSDSTERILVQRGVHWQPHTPIGGFTGKRSGIGRIGGMYTLLEMTQVKTITVDVGDEAR